MKKIVFLVCMLVSQALFTFAQDLIKVQGRVLDAKTKEPIPGASVYIENSVIGEFTKVAVKFNNRQLVRLPMLMVTLA